MTNLKDKLKMDKKTFINVLLIVLPLIAIIFKSVLIQAYIVNDNAYALKFGLGFGVSSVYLINYLAFPLLFLSFALLLKNKWRVFYVGFINILMSALMLLDISYFRGFYTFPSVLLATQTANLDNMGDTILSMFSVYDVLFVIDIFVWILLVVRFKDILFKQSVRYTKAFFATIILSICVIGYTPFNYYVLNNTDVVNSSMLKITDPTLNLRVWGPIGYHLQDLIVVYDQSKPYKMTEEETAKADKFFEVKKEDIPDNEYFGAFKDYNLLVIQVESLETFALQQKIDGQEVSPVMNDLIDTGIYFPNILEQVNQGTSSDSDLLVNTSMFPLRRGSTFFRYPNTTYNSMPQILEGHGYDTYAIHPDKGSFWNYNGGLSGIGFDTFWDQFTFEYDEQLILGLSDESFFRQITPRIEAMKDPFYTFAVTLTNHAPFNLPDEKRQLILDPELDENKMGGYLQCVNYTDTQIGTFLKQLDEAGKLDNTLVAIVGDHTGIHKYYNQEVEELSNPEDWMLYDGTAETPLILWTKDMKNPKTFDTIGGQVDIMPTLLYGLGIERSEFEGYTMGRPLLNTNKSFAITNGGVFVGEDNLSPEEKELQLQVLELSDVMIRSNYFKDKINN